MYRTMLEYFTGNKTGTDEEKIQEVLKKMKKLSDQKKHQMRQKLRQYQDRAVRDKTLSSETSSMIKRAFEASSNALD